MAGDRREEFEAEALPHATALYRAALRSLRSPDDAAAVVQETFLRAFRTHDSFVPGTSAKAWLFTILYSVVSNRARKARRTPPTVSVDGMEERLPGSPPPTFDGTGPEIVAAHVSNNTVALSDLPGLIEQVYRTLASVGGTEIGSSDRPTPAVPIKKSMTPDFIVCLEDGKKLKMLKRHLKTAYNMTPEEYRERWGLSPDYPMVAPNYAKQRSRLAKQIGLGTRSRRGRQA